MKIDAHQHTWRYSPAEYGWIQASWTTLQQNRLPADLAPLLQAAGLEGTVVVQARQSLAETAWLLALADQVDFIKGVVGWVDLCSPALREQLDHFAAHPRFKGVRHVIQDEPDPAFMLRDDFRRGQRLLADYQLSYDILISPHHLDAACRLVGEFPDQPFVLDHIAKPFIREGTIEPWASDIRRLAAFPHVFCKVSGMVTEADWQRWQPSHFEPYLDIIFEAFTPQRLMFGSDWPVCTLAASYAQVVDLLRNYTQRLSPSERAQIWGETATRFYHLHP